MSGSSARPAGCTEPCLSAADPARLVFPAPVDLSKSGSCIHRTNKLCVCEREREGGRERLDIKDGLSIRADNELSDQVTVLAGCHSSQPAPPASVQDCCSPEGGEAQSGRAGSRGQCPPRHGCHPGALTPSRGFTAWPGFWKG